MTHAVLLFLALAAAPPSGADSVRTDREVRETVLRHATDVRRCYQNEGLRCNPSLSGEVELELTILPTGRVDSAAVAATSLRGPGDQEVTGCMTAMARNWRFERGPYLVERVLLPFVFSPDRATTETIASDDER